MKLFLLYDVLLLVCLAQTRPSSPSWLLVDTPLNAPVDVTTLPFNWHDVVNTDCKYNQV